MATWGSSSETANITLSAGNIHCSGGLWTPTGQQFDSVSFNSRTSSNLGGKIRIGLFSGAGAETSDWGGSPKNLIEDLGEHTLDDVVEWKTYLSSTNPQIPDGEDLWVVLVVDVSKGISVKGGALPNTDIIAAERTTEADASSSVPFTDPSDLGLWNERDPAISFTVNYSPLALASPKIITDGVDNPKIVDSNGVLLSGTHNYTVLTGSDIATATYAHSGQAEMTDGVIVFEVPNGEQTVGTEMLVLLQSDTDKTNNGAYEMTITEVS